MNNYATSFFLFFAETLKHLPEENPKVAFRSAHIIVASVTVKMDLDRKSPANLHSLSDQDTSRTQNTLESFVIAPQLNVFQALAIEQRLVSQVQDVIAFCEIGKHLLSNCEHRAYAGHGGRVINRVTPIPQ